jgi:hypothetical protein
MTRGAIYNEQAYAQGKMLDHVSWNGILPRCITPSDIDMAFDNNGWILSCELSSKSTDWGQLSKGQLLFYKAFTAKSRTMAALLKHNVPKDRKIDTLADIESFQVMLAGGKITEVFNSTHWKRFVESFFESPSELHVRCYESCKAVL